MNSLKENEEVKRGRIHTLRGQIAGLFIVFLLFSILAVSAVNMVFLERYYLSKKIDAIQYTIDQLETMEFQGDENPEKSSSVNISDEFRKETLENNGRVALYDYRDISDKYAPRQHCDFETCTLEIVQKELEGMYIFQ